MSAKAPKPTSQERLRRLLFLVPYVARHPGESVETVARAAGLTKTQLLEDLELLTLVGRPPFQPDDFVDIYVEDDKVYVDLDQRLSAPPRLTAAEGGALAAAAALLKPAAGDALRGVLEKLEKVLPSQALERFRDVGRALDLTVDGPAGFATLTQAIVEHREVSFDYFAAGKGQTESRRAQPHELISHRGQWYLSAFCLTRQDTRLFRLDRMAHVQRLEGRFEAPAPGAARSLPGLDEARQAVKVRFSAQTAPYVKERFGPSATERANGELEVQVPGDSERWLTQWVLSFGGEAVVVEPAWAVEAVAKAARACLPE